MTSLLPVKLDDIFQGRSRLISGCAAIMCAVAVWLSSPSTTAASSGSIPSRAVKVVGGHGGTGSSWGVWLFGKRGRGCWATRTLDRGQVTGESVTCGYSVPSHRFQLAASGTVLGGRSPQSLLFFLVRSPEVKEIRVLVSVARRPAHWVSIAARQLNPASRASAQVPAKVGFAARLVAGKHVCPRRVVAYDGTHRSIGRESLPRCE